MSSDIRLWYLKRLAALALSLGLAFGVTVPKLYKMTQIKGWLPGATRTQLTVTQKWLDTSRGGGKEVYWIAFTDASIYAPGPHRANVRREAWDGLRLGDPIDGVRVPGDPWTYLPDGIFVEEGNFNFDLTLLAVTLAVAAVVLWQLIHRRPRPISGEVFREGGKRTITVNAYERDV